MAIVDVAALAAIITAVGLIGNGFVRKLLTGGFLSVALGGLGAGALIVLCISACATALTTRAVAVEAGGRSDALGAAVAAVFAEAPYLRALCFALGQPTVPAMALVGVALVITSGAVKLAAMGNDWQMLCRHLAIMQPRIADVDGELKKDK